jgi:hypothetical protein
LSTFTDDFGFDSQVLVAAAHLRLRIGDVPVPTVYTPQSSQIGLRKGIRYTLATLAALGRHVLQRTGLASFASLRPVPPEQQLRPSEVPPPPRPASGPGIAERGDRRLAGPA